MKLGKLFCFLLIFIVLLPACASASATVALPTVTATQIPPALTLSLTSTPFVTNTATPIPTIPVSSPPDGLRMTYIVGGNLYFQDGSASPIQLTYSGEDSTPVFSDDGRRLIFYRGLIPHDLYSINMDETNEKRLVTGSMLENLGLGYDKYTEIVTFTYVPGTHQVLFNTRQLSQGDIDQKDFNRLGSKSNLDLLSVNIDTGEIKSLLSRGKGGKFYISPNGRMIAVEAKGHIDVVSIDGQMVKRNLITYTPTRPYDLAINVSWNSDSTELIVSLPSREIFDMSGPEAYTIWRYTVDDNSKLQLSFNPLPLDNCCASPNGNWFLYSYYYYPGKTSDKIPSGLYLRNLNNSVVQLYDPFYLSYYWSPDSVHFVFGENKLFLGSINERPKFIGQGQFLGWLDGSRFLYYGFENDLLNIGNIGKPSTPIFTSMPKRLTLQGASSFTFVFLDGNTTK